MRLLLVSSLCLLELVAPSLAAAAIGTQLVAGGVPYLIDIQHAGDGSGRLFLVEQSGRIVIYDGSAVLPTPFLDISSLVSFGGEQGLLGLAFDPGYASNGFFFVDYTDVLGDTVVARYHAADPDVADPNSAVVVITQQQPFANHNGGQVRFGPDGFLYIALGDGGSGGDPFDNGQHLNTLLGKLLRIDVHSLPYTVPPDNPFVGTAGALGEIWDYGLRNPWRFAFDRLTGDLIIGDVGQNAWEEVDVEPAGSGGRNYGWRLMEGLHCYTPSSGCDPGGLTMPVVEYSHALGCAVMGGFRYRGSSLPGMAGTYFFSDECGGRIWGATPDGAGNWTATEFLHTGLTITTFGEDPAGELYISAYGTGSNAGLYRIVTAAPRPTLTVGKIGVGSGRIASSPVALDCGSVCGVQLAPNTVVTLTPTADPGFKFSGWSGDADCADGAVTLAADRSCIATFDRGFTDDPIAAASTAVKALHVTELRARIDALRGRFGLKAFKWTDVPLTAGASLPLAVHVNEMQTALNEAYAAAHVSPPPSYSGPPPAAGGPILAVYISDLRSAVLVLEGS